MKVEFTLEYEAKTVTGARRITAGTVLDLAEDKALKLVRAGVARPFVDPSAPWPPVDPDARPWIDERGCLVIPFNSPVKYRWWQAGGQSVMETLKELFEERAAIMEHDGGLSREEAEQEAARIMARYEPHF